MLNLDEPMYYFRSGNLKRGRLEVFLEYKTDKIIKGIFIGVIIYFIGYGLLFLATLSNTTSEIGHYITVGMFYLGNLCKPIGILVVFNSLCDILYKALKALDKYTNEHS